MEEFPCRMDGENYASGRCGVFSPAETGATTVRPPHTHGAAGEGKGRNLGYAWKKMVFLSKKDGKSWTKLMVKNGKYY